MFVLSKISDLIRIDPQNFAIPLAESLEDEINKKYANRVIHNVGLCICLYDVLKFNDGMTRNGDGGVFIKCTFRLIVFRPFIGEILVGTVSSCTEEGLNIRMEFFEDIHIPKELLFESCKFVPGEQAWVWKNGEFDFYIDTNEKIRFRVEQEIFTQQHPRKPSNNPVEEEMAAANQIPPYSILGSCQADGMGLISWWD